MKLMVLSNEVRIRRSVARLAIAMIPFLGFWASCGGKEGDSLFGAGGSVGASGSTTVASTTSTTTGSGDTSTSGTGGSIAGMGGSGGQGGTGSQRDAEMTGGADGSRDAGRTDAACISEEGGPCGGLLINPCQCADGLVCVFIHLQMRKRISVLDAEHLPADRFQHPQRMRRHLLLHQLPSMSAWIASGVSTSCPRSPAC